MHITKEQLNAYIANSMSQTEQIAFFEHISECEFCAGKLAGAMLQKEQELVFTPPDLKSNILEQTVYKKTSDIIKLPQEVLIANIKKKQREFWMYTAKVVFAVCAAVTIIMMPADVFPSSSGSYNTYMEAKFPLTKEITEEDVKDNFKILDLFKNTSAKISSDVSKALKLDKR